jgi:hypothetical protein
MIKGTRQPLIDRSVERFDKDGKQTVFAIAPFGNSETREERLLRHQELGSYDPNCPTCVREKRDHPTLDPFMPNHTASPRCRSGRRNHCTCDTCF